MTTCYYSRACTSELRGVRYFELCKFTVIVKFVTLQSSPHGSCLVVLGCTSWLCYTANLLSMLFLSHLDGFTSHTPQSQYEILYLILNRAVLFHAA